MFIANLLNLWSSTYIDTFALKKGNFINKDSKLEHCISICIPGNPLHLLFNKLFHNVNSTNK